MPTSEILPSITNFQEVGFRFRDLLCLVVLLLGSELWLYKIYLSFVETRETRKRRSGSLSFQSTKRSKPFDPRVPVFDGPFRLRALDPSFHLPPPRPPLLPSSKDPGTLGPRRCWGQSTCPRGRCTLEGRGGVIREYRAGAVFVPVV